MLLYPVKRLFLPARRASVARPRAALRRHLEAAGVCAPRADDLVLAADEALVNAILHGGDPEGGIAVLAQVEERRVLVEITDGGRGFALGAHDIGALPDPLAADGRGLFLIGCLMDEVELTCDPTGTQVTMTTYRGA